MSKNAFMACVLIPLVLLALLAAIVFVTVWVIGAMGDNVSKLIAGVVMLLGIGCGLMVGAWVSKRTTQKEQK